MYITDICLKFSLVLILLLWRLDFAIAIFYFIFENKLFLSYKIIIKASLLKRHRMSQICRALQ